MDSEHDDELDYNRREEARPCPSGPPVNHYQPSGHRYTKKELTDRLAYAEAKAWSVLRKRQMCPLPLPEATERRIRQWFELVDGDGSGQLNAGDLEFALKAAGIPANPNTVAEIIKLFDFDQDGEIAWREFHHVLSYEVMADKDPLGSEYVLPSGMSLPLGSMIETIRRRKILDDVQKGGVYRDFWAAEGPDFLRCLLQSEDYTFEEESREILRRILSYKAPKDADASLFPEAVEEHKRRIERLKLALMRDTGAGAATGGKHGGSQSGPRQGIGRPKAGQQQHQFAAAAAAASSSSPWSSPAAAAVVLAEGSTSSSRRSLDAVTMPLSRATRLLRTQYPLRRETDDSGAQPSTSLWWTSSLWEANSAANSAAASAAAAVESKRSKGNGAAAPGAGCISGFGGSGAEERDAGTMEGGPSTSAKWAAGVGSGSNSSNPDASDCHGPASAPLGSSLGTTPEAAAAMGAGVWSATAPRPLHHCITATTTLPALDPSRQAAAAHGPRAGPPDRTQHQQHTPLPQAAAGGFVSGGVLTGAAFRPPAQRRLSAFGAAPPPNTRPAPSTAAAVGGGDTAAGAAAQGGDAKLTVPDAACNFSGVIKDMRQSWDAEALFNEAVPLSPPPPGGAVPLHCAPSLPLKLIHRSLSTGRTRPYSNSLVKAARGGRRVHAASAGPSGGGSRATGGGGGTAAPAHEGSGLDDRFSFDASPMASSTAPGPAAVAAVAPVERSAVSASASLGSGGNGKAAGGVRRLSVQQFASALLQRADAAAVPVHPYTHPHPPPSPTAARPLMANGRAEAAAAAAEIRRSVWDAMHHHQRPPHHQPRGGWPAAAPPAMPSPRLPSYGGQGTTSLAAQMLLSSTVDCASGAGLLARHGRTHTGECHSGLGHPGPQQQQHALAQLGGSYAQGSVPPPAAAAAAAPADVAFPPWTTAAAAPVVATRAADVQRPCGSCGPKSDAALQSTLITTAAAPLPAGQARPLVPTPTSPQPLKHDAAWDAVAAQLSYGLSLPISPSGASGSTAAAADAAAAATAAASCAEGGRFLSMGARRSFDLDPSPGKPHRGATAAASPRSAAARGAGRGTCQSSQGQGCGRATRGQHAPGFLGRPSVGLSPPASPVQLIPQITLALPSPPHSSAQKEATTAGGVAAAAECPALSPQQLHQQRRPQLASGDGNHGNRSCVDVVGDGEAVPGFVGKEFRADAQQQRLHLQQPHDAVGRRPSTGRGEAASAAGSGVSFGAGGAQRKQDGARRATEASTAGGHWPWPWRKDMVAVEAQGAATGAGTQEGLSAKPQPRTSRFRSSFLHWS